MRSLERSNTIGSTSKSGPPPVPSRSGVSPRQDSSSSKIEPVQERERSGTSPRLPRVDSPTTSKWVSSSSSAGRSPVSPRSPATTTAKIMTSSSHDKIPSVGARSSDAASASSRSSETTVENALLKACFVEDVAEVERLLSKPDEVDVNARRESDGMSCLHVAALRANGSIFAELLKCEGLSINTQDKMGETALLVCAKRGWHEGAKMLLEKKADPNAANEKGLTPMVAAATRGHAKVVQLLTRVRIPAAQHNAALMVASKAGHTAVIEALLRKALVDVNLEDEKGFTPLERAINNGHKDAAVTLVRAGAQLGNMEQRQEKSKEQKEAAKEERKQKKKQQTEEKGNDDKKKKEKKKDESEKKKKKDTTTEKPKKGDDAAEKKKKKDKESKKKDEKDKKKKKKEGDAGKKEKENVESKKSDKKAKVEKSTTSSKLPKETQQAIKFIETHGRKLSKKLEKLEKARKNQARVEEAWRAAFVASQEMLFQQQQQEGKNE